MDQNVVNNFVKVYQEHKHVVVKDAGGLRGLQGPAGAGLEITGSVDTYNQLPYDLQPEDAGKAYFVQSDGKLYVWSGSRWPADGEGSAFQGPRGFTGARGDTGPANHLSIGTVQTGASAAATITGAAPDQTLNLTLPKGDAGRDGEDAYIPSEASFKSALLDFAYPVGSIYMSTNNVSPSLFLGGTWVQIEDKFLLAAGSVYSGGATGGEASHTLSVSEMPSHTHDGILWANNFPLSFDDGATDGFKPSANWQQVSTNQKFVASATGGGQAHNNMPPYIAVYMWERTD